MRTSYLAESVDGVIRELLVCLKRGPTLHLSITFDSADKAEEAEARQAGRHAPHKKRSTATMQDNKSRDITELPTVRIWDCEPNALPATAAGSCSLGSTDETRK